MLLKLNLILGRLCDEGRGLGVSGIALGDDIERGVKFGRVME